MPRQSQYDTSGALEGYVPYEHQHDWEATLYNRPWHIAKIAIRGCNLGFSIILVIISGINSLYLWNRGPYLLWFGAIPSILAIAWDAAEFITICARGGKKGIPPGAHVGMHLIFSLVLTIGVVTASLFVYYDGYWLRNEFGRMHSAAFVFACLVLLTHFTLFVRACVDTHRYNARPPIYMVPVSAPPPMQPAGSYAPYPFPPQQPQSVPPHEEGKMTGANAPMETMTMPGPDGTYYGPGSRV